MDDKKNIIIEHYIDRVKNYNIPEYQVLDWESREAQEARFKALLDNFNIENSILLDVGCGLGHLAEYIDNANIKINYIGVDIMSEMIERAKTKRFKNISAQFLAIDIFKSDNIQKYFDYIYSSGIFNLNLGNNEEFFNNALKIFFTYARKGVCFNLLDISCRNKYGDKYYYYEQKKVISQTENILKLLNIHYNLRVYNKYLSNDFSVCVDIL